MPIKSTDAKINIDIRDIKWYIMIGVAPNCCVIDIVYMREELCRAITPKIYPIVNGLQSDQI